MGFKWNNENLRLISNALNISINDQYHVGYSLRHDGEKFEKLKWQLAKTLGDKSYFVRGNTLGKYVVLGHTHEHEGKLSAFELKYDITGENAGLWGSHVDLKAAKTLRPSPNIEIIAKTTIGSEVTCEGQWH